MENNKIDNIIKAFRKYVKLKEEGVVGMTPTNNISGEKIAMFDPILGKKKKKDGSVDFRRIPPNFRKWVKE